MNATLYATAALCGSPFENTTSLGDSRFLDGTINAYDEGSYPQLAMAGIKNGKLDLIGGRILVGALTNDPVYGAFLEYIPSGTGKVFLCPAKRLSSNDVPARIDYGYNAIGAAWHGNDRLALGLAPAQIWTNWSSFGSLGQIDRVYESMVANPSDMIALGDSSSTVPDPYHPVPDVIDPYVEEYKIFAPVANLHSQGANVVFCDSHVEYGKQTAWMEPTDKAMQRWNRDHEAHLKY